MPLCGFGCVRSLDGEITLTDSEIAAEFGTWELADKVLFEAVAPIYVPQGTSTGDYKWCCVLANILKSRTCRQVRYAVLNQNSPFFLRSCSILNT